MGDIKKLFLFVGMTLCLCWGVFAQTESTKSDSNLDMDFHVGLGYLLQNEFSSVNYYGNFIDYYSLLHGFSINSSINVYQNEDAKIGFTGGLCVGMPNSLYSCFNNDRRENFNLLNCYFTGVMMSVNGGVQFRHFINYYRRIETSVCGKIGFCLTSFKYGENYSQTNSNYNITFGLSGKVNYTHYFNNNYGISAGLSVDYDFISLAQLVNPSDYQGYGVIELMPFVSAVIKF